jgi:hypothetical protein
VVVDEPTVHDRLSFGVPLSIFLGQTKWAAGERERERERERELGRKKLGIEGLERRGGPLKMGHLVGWVFVYFRTCKKM